MIKNFLLFIGLLGLTSMDAQGVKTQTKTMSLGPQNAYYIEIAGADEDLAEDAWKEYVKEVGKTKENKKAKELYTNDARVPMINGTTPSTLYAHFEEGKGQTTAYLWVDLGGSFANANDNKTQSAGIETFLSDYYIMLRKKVIDNELKEEEKKLKNLQKDLTKLEKKNTDLHEDIENYKKKIMEAEKNIEKNLTEQDDKRVEIGTQQKIVDKVVERLNNVGKEK